MKAVALSLIFACTASASPGDTCHGTQDPCHAGEFCSHYQDSNGVWQGVCATCAQCAIGQRIDSICQGDSDTDCQDCRLNDARGCGPHRYIATPGVCDGTGVAHLDESDCMPCRACGIMEYIADSCEWNSLSDTQICTPCLYPCQPGQYIPTDGNCNGHGTISVPDCDSCDTCTDRQYASTPCSGAGHLRDQGCTDCQPCPQGLFMVETCTGSGSTCAACRVCAQGVFEVSCP